MHGRSKGVSDEKTIAPVQRLIIFSKGGASHLVPVCPIFRGIDQDNGSCGTPPDPSQVAAIRIAHFNTHRAFCILLVFDSFLLLEKMLEILKYVEMDVHTNRARSDLRRV